MTQLSLLDWTPPRKVIPFPSDRRVGKVRHTADLLLSKHGDPARAYWRSVVTGLARQLDAAGIPADERDRQCRLFFNAVQHELQRRAGHGRRPGGDAA